MKIRALPKSCSCLTPLYGGALFAVDDWRCAGHDSGPHEEWCAEDRVVFTRRGLWELHIAGRRQLGDPLQAVLWHGQSSFRVRHPVGGSDDCTVLRLTPAGAMAFREIRGSTEAKNPTPLFERASQPLSARAFATHWQLLKLARDTATDDELAIEHAALKLLTDVALPRVHEPECNQNALRLAHNAREVIAKRYSEALSLTDMAIAVGCSPFHLARQFKRCMGISLHQALTTWRLRVGLERVLDQPDQLATIALDLGFASHSHFSDAFRAHYGYSPQQARMDTRRQLRTI